MVQAWLGAGTTSEPIDDTQPSADSMGISPELLAQVVQQQAPQQQQPTPPCSIWPDTIIPFALFRALGTSWLQGPAGPTGINWAALDTACRLARIPRRKLRPAVLSDLRAMESAALQWHATTSTTDAAKARTP